MTEVKVQLNLMKRMLKTGQLIKICTIWQYMVSRYVERSQSSC